MTQDDLKPYNSRPGEANIKSEQPEKSEERYPKHHSKLDEQGKVTGNQPLRTDITNDQGRIQKANAGRREYRIW